MSDLFSPTQLNPEQEAAVSAKEGYYQVSAGPGSGKTRCLTGRYSRLIESGVSPDDILCLTFTAEAAKEMRQRVELRPRIVKVKDVFPNDFLSPLKPTKEITKEELRRPAGFMTLHSLALGFATTEHENFPFKLNEYFPLATPEISRRVIGRLVRGRRDLAYRDLAAYISAQKRRGTGPQQAIDEAMEPRQYAMAQAYQGYETELRKQGLLDFDGLIIEMRLLLATNEDVWDRWQYKFIMTDESQDLDRAQWNLVQLLSGKYQNVWSVGDVNQCVYSWRSAQPELFRDLENIFGDVKTFYLGANYRSTVEIVDFLKKISPVKDGLAEHFHSETGHGPEPVFRAYDNDLAEAEGVLEEILRMNSNAP